MNTPGERLREERQRLNLNQTDFGAIGGVKLLAQINYEKGVRQPDLAYLVAIAAAGADVCYILTGTRSTAAPCATPLLTEEEEELLEGFRRADVGGRAMLLGAVRAAMSAPNKPSAKPNARNPSRDQSDLLDKKIG